jgi:diketogulonate reductase-like aldo/keto reductase
MLGAINLFRTMFGLTISPQPARGGGVKVLAVNGKTLPQFALRWTLSHNAIHTGLVGFRRAAEVEENLGALGFAITPADMAAVDAIFARNDVVTEPPGWLEDEPAA